jgi:hypothetical protein
VFRKFSTIRDPGKLTYAKLLQIAGPLASRLVAENSQDEGKQYNMGSVRNALAIVAGAGKRGNEKLGQGIWRLGDNVVLVNGSHIAIYDGEKLTQEFSAVHGDHVFELGGANEWYDYERVNYWISQPNRSGFSNPCSSCVGFSSNGVSRFQTKMKTRQSVLRSSRA